jgi:hypothetical protein
VIDVIWAGDLGNAIRLCREEADATSERALAPVVRGTALTTKDLEAPRTAAGL